MDQTGWDQYFMTAAITEALAALNEGVFPVGSVIVRGEEIVAKAHKFHGGMHRFDHAECLAMRKAFETTDTNGTDLCVYSNLEPCTMCFGAMLNARIKRVVFALEDPYDGYAKKYDKTHATPRHQDRIPEVVGGVLREESRLLFNEYFRTTENVFWKNAQGNPLVMICKD
jgi:tRNA(adenine34) deaminase